MKSIRGRFNILRRKKEYIGFSDYLIFVETIKDKTFTKEIIYRNFPKILKEGEDYFKEDKLEILKYLSREYSKNALGDRK